MPRRAAGVIERTMNPPATKPPALPAAQAFAGTLAAIVGDLRKLVAAGIHILGPLTWHLSNRIGRAARRVERLMARLADGTWRPPRPRTPDTSRSEVATGATAGAFARESAAPDAQRSGAATKATAVPLHRESAPSFFLFPSLENEFFP